MYVQNGHYKCKNIILILGSFCYGPSTLLLTNDYGFISALFRLLLLNGFQYTHMDFVSHVSF